LASAVWCGHSPDRSENPFKANGFFAIALKDCSEEPEKAPEIATKKRMLFGTL